MAEPMSISNLQTRPVQMADAGACCPQQRPEKPQGGLITTQMKLLQLNQKISEMAANGKANTPEFKELLQMKQDIQQQVEENQPKRNFDCQA